VNATTLGLCDDAPFSPVHHARRWEHSSDPGRAGRGPAGRSGEVTMQ
jgi:hypothetical protein